MWILYAAGSAFFAGITSILAKCGIRKTDSTVATSLRTMVILLFSWLIVWIADCCDQWRNLTVFGFIRSRNRGFMVVLFSGITNRGY